MSDYEIRVRNATDISADAKDVLLGRFDWHPQYRGRYLGEAYAHLKTEIAADQQAFAAAMAGHTGKHDLANLADTVELERKWQEFDPNWANAGPHELAMAVTTFEKARDDKQELFSFDRYKAGIDHAQQFRARHGRDESNIDVALAGAKQWVVLLIVVAVVVVLLLLI